MIEALYTFGPDVVLVRIEGHNILFGNTAFGAQLATIDGLQLSKEGVEREFPDLVGNPEWRSEAISRFKKNIKSMKGEKVIMNYITSELKPHGYILNQYQQNGYRKVKA